jgi:hypothetical protein
MDRVLLCLPEIFREDQGQADNVFSTESYVEDRWDLFSDKEFRAKFTVSMDAVEFKPNASVTNEEGLDEDVLLLHSGLPRVLVTRSAVGQSSHIPTVRGAVLRRGQVDEQHRVDVKSLIKDRAYRRQQRFRFFTSAQVQSKVDRHLKKLGRDARGDMGERGGIPNPVDARASAQPALPSARSAPREPKDSRLLRKCKGRSLTPCRTPDVTAVPPPPRSAKKPSDPTNAMSALLGVGVSDPSRPRSRSRSLRRGSRHSAGTRKSGALSVAGTAVGSQANEPTDKSDLTLVQRNVVDRTSLQGVKFALISNNL